jgi:hypothetical protein
MHILHILHIVPRPQYAAPWLCSDQAAPRNRHSKLLAAAIVCTQQTIAAARSLRQDLDAHFWTGSTQTVRMYAGLPVVQSKIGQ